MPRLVVWTLFILLLASSLLAHLSAAEPSSPSILSLQPDVPARHRLAPVSTELDNIQLFHLLDLKPNSYYEVPFSFRLSLPAPSAPSVSPASRHLLDIEKLTLATNAEGRVLREEVPADHIDGQAVVQLDVSWSGRAPSAEAEAALRSAGVEYIIVCDTLLAPGLPRFVPALLAVLAVALLVGIRYVVPLIIRHARAVEVEAQSESGKQR